MNQHQHDGDSEHDHISVPSSESNDAVSDIVESISSDPNGSIAGEPTEPDSGEPHAYDVPTYDSYDGGTAVGYEFSPSPFEHQVAVIYEIPSITSTNRVSDDDFSDFGFMRHDVTRPAFARPDLPVRPFAFGYVCSGDRGIGRVQGMATRLRDPLHCHLYQLPLFQLYQLQSNLNGLVYGTLTLMVCVIHTWMIVTMMEMMDTTQNMIHLSL